jgi:tRNA1(Val) A37 N6-methylase TrmN6
MPVQLDPEENEIRALSDLVDMHQRRVLEIGSGDGRLTWRYAARAAHVTAVEPFAGSLEKARAALPAALRGRVHFHHGDIGDFAASRPPELFDVALFSWSL